jgi:inorganic pyrophosphatase
MASSNLEFLGAWDPQSGQVNVIIETVKGSRNKFAYEPGSGTFALTKVLPSGMVFPLHFGFIPSTLGDDGDPLDVLVLLDEPVFAGCRIPCRLVGVLEAEQADDGEVERNDRILAVAVASHDHRDVRSIKDINEHLLEEIEHFFASYNEMEGKEFKPLSWHGPHRATKLAREGAKRFEQDGKAAGGEGQPRPDGRSTQAKPIPK